MSVRRGVAAALLLLAGCGGGAGTQNGGPCEGLLKPADPAAALPSGVPAGVAGATFYEVETQGATRRHYARLPGSDFVATRDTIKAAYEAAGLTIEGTDQEAVEAEFQWSGNGREGSVQVIALCRDHLRIRYRAGPS